MSYLDSNIKMRKNWFGVERKKFITARLLIKIT